MATQAVATHGLVRDYGHGAGLHGIDLAVHRNEVYGLIGRNGAGKTTLLSILAGLRHADAGRIEINVPDGQVAMCPDEPEFEPWLTASEVVRQSHGLATRARRASPGSDPGESGCTHPGPGGSRCCRQQANGRILSRHEAAAQPGGGLDRRP